MIFKHIININKVKLSEFDVLVEIRKTTNSKIILTDDANTMSEEGREYAIVVSVGESVDKGYCSKGTIILSLRGQSFVGFEHKNKKYMVIPVHAISLCTPATNFDLESKPKKNVSKSLQEVKS